MRKTPFLLGVAAAALAASPFNTCSAAGVAMHFGCTLASRIVNEDAPSLEDLQNRLIALAQASTGLHAAADLAGEDLTPAQQAELDRNYAEFESVKAQITMLTGRQVGQSRGRQVPPLDNVADGSPAPTAVRASAPATPIGAAPAPSVLAAPSWRARDGSVITCLAPGQTVSSTLRPTMSASGRQVAPPNLGETVRALITGNWDRVDGGMRNAVVEGGGDSTGGTFILPTVAGFLIDIARANATVFRAGAQTMVMRSNEYDLVKIAGDVSPGWVAEAGAIPKSDPTFARLPLIAHKLAVITTISRELAEDAPNAAAQIQTVIGNAFAAEIDRVALFGSGSGAEPTGIYNTTGVQSLAVGGAMTYDTLLTAISDIEAYNDFPTAAILSPHASAALRSLKDSTGAYLAPPVALDDVKLLTTSKVSSDKGIVGDFRQLIVGFRTQIQFETSTQADTAFDNDLVLIKARVRVAIGVVRPADFVKLSTIS